MPTISLPFAYTFITICLLSVSRAGWRARREGIHFGVAGGCIPFPYHVLTLSLPFAYCLSHVQDGEQDVRGAIVWGCWRLPTISLPSAYTFLTICLLSVSCAGWRARYEGSHFGVAGIAYHFLTICLHVPYHLLTVCLMCRMESYM